MTLTEITIKLVESKNWAEEKRDTFKPGLISINYYNGYADGLQLALENIRKLEIKTE